MAQYMIDIIFSISADTYNFQSIQYSADTDKLPAIEIFPYQLIDTDNRYDRICDLWILHIFRPALAMPVS